MIRTIAVDGTEQEHKYGGYEPSLSWLQAWVGGYIEVVKLDEDTMMIMDEEGKKKGKLVNRTATHLFHRHHPMINDVIVGDVIILTAEHKMK